MRFNREDWSHEAAVDYFVANMWEHVNVSTQEEFDAAVGWYSVAQMYARELGETLGLRGRRGILVGAGMLAVLSPGISWATNVREAVRIASFDIDGDFASYGRNVGKAMAIADEGYVSIYVKGRKTRSFAACIVNPHTSKAVVIDRWIARAAGVNHGLYNMGVYDAVAEAMTFIADKVGMDVPSTQALVWVVARRGAGAHLDPKENE